MTWVKVCGLTNESAVAAAVDGGADAAGFVLARTSPRYLSVDDAAVLMEGVPVSRFIVTVDLTVEEAMVAADVTGADGIQAHGINAQEVAAEAVAAGYLSLYPVSVGTGAVSESLRSVPVAVMPLLDTYSDDQHGGTGVTFDWTLIDDPGRPFVLAGGLGPENVAEAVASVRPFGVDASSRLESSRGVKDPIRIIEFIRKAKEAWEE